MKIIAHLEFLSYSNTPTSHRWHKSQRATYRWMIFCLALLVALPAWGFTPKSGSPMARRLHPRLHLTPDNIPNYRQSISTHYRQQFQDYVNWVVEEDVLKKYAGDNVINQAAHQLIRALMVHQAFIAALGQVPGITYPYNMNVFARKAVDRLISQLRSGSQVSYVGALVYDWAYQFMTPAERIESANLLAQATAQHQGSGISLQNPVFNPNPLFSSFYYESFHPWYLGLALWGDGVVDSVADRAVDSFNDVMLNFGHLDAINFSAGQGGGWDEWIGYSNWHPRSHALRLQGWHTATGDNSITSAGTIDGNALTHYARFIYYAVDPHKYHGTTYTYSMMGGAAPGTTKISGNSSQNSLLFFLPQMYASAGLSTEAGLVRHFLNVYEQNWVSEYHFDDLWAFLGVPLASAAVTPQAAGLPKSNWSENLGLFFARTGFGNAHDGVFFVADSHFRYALERGVQAWPGFGLVKFGPLISTRSAEIRSRGNLSNYAGGQRENVVYFDGGHQIEAPDIVQRTHLQQAWNGQGNFDGGGIEQVISQDGIYYHVRVNRSRRFTSGVTHTREFVWIPGPQPQTDSDFLVVYDRTQSPSAPHWIYHVPWKPTVSGHSNTSDLTLGSGLTGRIGTAYEGSGLLVKELNSIGDEKDNAGGTANFTGGAGAHGVLFAKTFLPASSRVEVTRVAQFDNNVFTGQSDLAIKAHRWQVDVIPLETRNDHKFLHVFEAADANLRANMTQAALMQAQGVDGVFITRQSPSHFNTVILFAKNASPLSSVQYSITAQGTTRHIITGLLPNAAYKVEDVASGSTLLTATTRQGTLWDYKGVDTVQVTGTLHFDAPLSGSKTYAVVLTGAASDQLPPGAPSGLLINP